MLIPMNHVKIFCATEPADMRHGFDRLARQAKESLEMDPYCGALFLFFNRGRNLARVIYFDGSGSCTFSKRLEQGTFKVPKIGDGQVSVEILASELSLLLEGVRIGSFRRPPPWQPSLS